MKVNSGMIVVLGYFNGAGDLDVSSKVGQLPKMDTNNVHLSSGQDLHWKTLAVDLFIRS
ncbi:hypothetical protein [Streptococcus gordonii]|uniref:hypothetical protein n=1 Tax=Streptococcus gordonii TaxID=1302 RepID=UPI0012DDCA22|nr:hypothetical protein [Streptococcus gordonii]MBZ2138367.1 hypothetical protein [Streptococcus gordonii]QGS44456.1 hypothetical protein FOB91_07125 [Streptococcus gordonii]